MKFNTRVTNAPTYPMAALATKKAELLKRGVPVFDFGTGDPLEPTPEFIRDALKSGVPAVSQYPTVKGTLALRSAIQGYLLRRFAVSVDAETEILPCTGSKESIYNLPFLLIGPGNPKDTIVGPDPGYPVMERSAVIAGAKYEAVPLQAANGFLLDLAALPKATLERTALAWINYPGNPTGAECDLAYLKKQVEIARAYDILLCSDECYVDIYFGAPPPSILQVTKDGVLAFHSCSKRSGMTTYRSGFVAGDAKVLAAYASFRNTVGTAAPSYTQAAAAAAWADDAHPEARRQIFRAKRDRFLAFFQKHHFRFAQSNATFYFWVEAPNGLTGEAYAATLLERGIIVSPGSFLGNSCPNYFRVALVPTVGECEKALLAWPT